MGNTVNLGALGDGVYIVQQGAIVEVLEPKEYGQDNDDPVRAFLNIEIEGKRRKLKQDLKIVFPEWLDVQPEKLHYI